MTDTFRKVYNLSEKNISDLNEIKDKASELYSLLEKYSSNRELSLSKTKLEESVMWASKGISISNDE